MEDKFKITKKAGIYGILGNIFLLVIKALVGYLNKSQAMIADSVNSAGDIFASLMTFIGNKIASVPKDKDHNLGHGIKVNTKITKKGKIIFTNLDTID